MEQNKNKTKLILDTNAFIQQINLKQLDEKYQLYTTNGVLAEIRDEKARERLEFNRLAIDIKTDVPSDNALKIVQDFAKKTGDFKTLSEIDMQVIALAVTFVEKSQKLNKLNKEPKKVQEYKLKPQKNMEEQQQTETIKKVEQTKDENNENDGFVEIKPKKNFKKNYQQKGQVEQKVNEEQNKNKPQQIVKQTEKKEEVKITEQKKEVKKTEKQEQEQKNENNDQTEKKEGQSDKNEKDQTKNANDSDSDDQCDDEWITPQNVHTYLNNITDEQSEILDEKEQEFGVAIATTDYAMQNVILQLGLSLRSFEGLQITNLKTFVLECYACWQICRQLDKEFCPNCGNKTLLKLTVQVNADGSLTCFRKKNFKVKTKGNIYPIPKFEGGQQQTELLLREDQFLIRGREHIMKEQERQKQADLKEAESQISNGFGFEIIKTNKKKQKKLEYGYGKINPNDQFAMKSKKKGKK